MYHTSNTYNSYDTHTCIIEQFMSMNDTYLYMLLQVLNFVILGKSVCIDIVTCCAYSHYT